MASIRMTEADVARDLHAVLAKVRRGLEVVIEEGDRPVAVLKPSAPERPGRKLSECVALARAYEADVDRPPRPDDDFDRDVQTIVDERRDSFEPPAWE